MPAANTVASSEPKPDPKPEPKRTGGDVSPPVRDERRLKEVGWQGFRLQTPASWDLTGFTGTDRDGYFRVDDGEEQGLEIKWATENSRTKTEPDVSQRAMIYFRSLRQSSKKRRATFDGRYDIAPRGGVTADRVVCGFEWTADRKAFGLVWYCKICRRVVIAQVLGSPSGRRGLAGNAQRILDSVRCHSDDDCWRWSIFDLSVDIPSAWKLSAPQLMNVYLKLSFTKGASRLTVEQWAAANVARGNGFFDLWLASNSRGPLQEMRYTVEESKVHGHPALRLDGGYGFGKPMIQPIKDITNLHRPATRFAAKAWECEPTNKIYLVQAIQPRSAGDIVETIAQRLACHEGALSGV